MSSFWIRMVVIIGALTVIGIFAMQAYYLRENFNKEEVEFNRSVNIALRNTAQLIASYNKVKLNEKGLIRKESSNLYVVNVNSFIEQSILVFYLESELDKQGIQTQFEYGIYDCANNELVYSECCVSSSQKKPIKLKKVKTKKSDVNHYFEVKFPDRNSYLYQEMSSVIIFSLLILLGCIIFATAIFIMLRQKRYSELMRDFVNNMTHEFKTPLSSIKLSTDVLLNHPLIQEDKRLLQYSTIISTQNQRINDHVEKILQIAKVESSTFHLKKEKLNLNELIEEIVTPFVLKANDRGGHVYRDYELENAQIQADRFHLSNVLSNLFDNAIKYSKEAPVVHVRLKRINDQACFEIEDQGIGIRQEHLDKIFNKFYRVPTGDVHDVKGYGIGLFYVHRICELHKFPVEIESKFGKGTNVRILFPNFSS
ncbi:MAG TPA: HAMP domain-containing sensor histidine kinase [Saprospiraceae bacterium]|nr:HAMP domain-containing sensor histidine kinase [Saprospiraceae bacterium]